jgi:hypothetical protein
MTEPLTIRMDPRVARDGVTQAELEEQLAHSLRVRDMVSEVNRLVARVQAAKKGATGQTLQQLTALERLLVAEPVATAGPGCKRRSPTCTGSPRRRTSGSDAMPWSDTRRSEGSWMQRRPRLGRCRAHRSSPPDSSPNFEKASQLSARRGGL